MASRRELAHAIRASCEIIAQPSVIIIGSQSVLAVWAEHELPDTALQSREVDVWPLADDAQSLAEVHQTYPKTPKVRLASYRRIISNLESLRGRSDFYLFCHNCDQ